MTQNDIVLKEVYNMSEQGYIMRVTGSKQQKVIIQRFKKNAFSFYSGDRS